MQTLKNILTTMTRAWVVATCFGSVTVYIIAHSAIVLRANAG